jgi:hypothetical protein
VKKFKSKNMEFHTYKLKKERSSRIVLNHIRATANLDNIKKETEDLGYTVTNI